MTARGFTLLEMLVALAILSLAALTLIRLDAFAVRTTAAVDGGAMARIVAANAATDILTSPTPPSPGQATAQVTNGGRNWSINTRVEPTSDPALLRITVTATGNDDRATLTIVHGAVRDAA